MQSHNEKLLISKYNCFRQSLQKVERAHISRAILRAVLICESLILSSVFDSEGSSLPNGLGLGCSPSCPLVASFKAWSLFRGFLFLSVLISCIRLHC